MLNVSCIPAFEDNYIWLIHGADPKRVAIVDPGDAGPVLERLRADGLTPTAILITHHHSDHIGGVQRLSETYELAVYGPADRRIPGITHVVDEGDRVILPELEREFQVLAVPGHTASHIAFYGHGALFCGDTLFTAGCGRLFEGTPEQMHASLSKFAALPDETLIYCAHEYTLANLDFAQVVEPDSTDLMLRLRESRALRAEDRPTVPATLALEKLTNPFLRCELPSVVTAAANFAGRELRSAAEVFGVVRHWKDTLD